MYCLGGFSQTEYAGLMCRMVKVSFSNISNSFSKGIKILLKWYKVIYFWRASSIGFINLS